MAASNDKTNASEPDETTALLAEEAGTTGDTSLSADGLNSGNADVESGEVIDGEGGEEDNPMFEGQKITRIGLLVPSVAIGVCFCVSFLGSEPWI